MLGGDMNDKLPKHLEIETKYKVDNILFEFKDLMQIIPEPYEFLFIEGPDKYFTKSETEFIRFRHCLIGESGRTEITFKQKLSTEHNIFRKEVNWITTGTPPEDITAGIEMLGYEFNFEIYKIAHIYKFEEAVIVFYSVKEKDITGYTHFIEIEVHEDLIPSLTEKQAWTILKKYEAFLTPLGIQKQHRVTQSLFEMYRK